MSTWFNPLGQSKSGQSLPLLKSRNRFKIKISDKTQASSGYQYFNGEGDPNTTLKIKEDLQSSVKTKLQKLRRDNNSRVPLPSFSYQNLEIRDSNTSLIQQTIARKSRAIALRPIQKSVADAYSLY